MLRVLLISKPVVPPWNDSGKNLVRDLACALTEHAPTVLGATGAACLPPPVHTLPLYPAAAASFAPRRIDQARVFARLATDRAHPVWHYFFAPNPVSCGAGRALSVLRRRPTVHTVSSAPRDPAAIVPRLFADMHAVLSAHTERRLLEAGLAPDRVVRIPPCIPPLDPPAAAERCTARERLALPLDVPLVVYPGDLEFGGGAERCVDALEAMTRSDALLVLACREKTARAAQVRGRLQAQVRARGLESRVRFLGEVPEIHALLGAADVVTLPSTDLYAKMDYPLVLLEAMSMARPVVVSQGTAAAELCEGEAAEACETSAEALGARLDRLIEDEVARTALGQRARARVQACFSPSTMARAYGRLYDRLA